MPSDKRLSIGAIRPARQDTAVGALFTQVVMIAVVVAVATTVAPPRRDAHHRRSDL